MFFKLCLFVFSAILIPMIAVSIMYFQHKTPIKMFYGGLIGVIMAVVIATLMVCYGYMIVALIEFIF